MKAAFKTDIGKKRKNNEDIILVAAEKGIFLLADGMGGHQGGEVASEIAVKESFAYLVKGIDKFGNQKDLSKFLVDAVIRAHNAIKRKAQSDINLTDMGTTLVEVVVKDDVASICHVGDSRAYVVRDGAIEQITNDHTLGFSPSRPDTIQEEEAPAKRLHILTQAVGVSDEPSPEVNHVDVGRGDYLLMCSDGLSDMLTDREILQIIQDDAEDIEAAVQRLVEEANKKGGKDNISVVLIAKA